MDETEALEQEATSDEESQESQETPVETEQTEYEFDVNGEKVKLDRDKFNEVLTATKNAESWEKKYHEKGRKLNQYSAELQAKEKELTADKALLDEWKAVKAKLDADPKSRQLIAEAVNKSKPSIDPVIREVQKENENLRKDIERDRAIQKMSKEFQDFDNDALADFQSDFNLNDMYDAMKFTYLARKGAGLDDEIQKARADMVKGMKDKKGSPPTGKKSAPPPNPKPKNYDDMIQQALERADNDPLF